MNGGHNKNGRVRDWFLQDPCQTLFSLDVVVAAVVAPAEPRLQRLLKHSSSWPFKCYPDARLFPIYPESINQSTAKIGKRAARRMHFPLSPFGTALVNILEFDYFPPCPFCIEREGEVVSPASHIHSRERLRSSPGDGR